MGERVPHPSQRRSYRWFLARAAPECDEQGRVKRVLGAHIDITDSKQTEERLRLSEERYRSLAEATSDIVWAGTMVDDEIEFLSGWS